jgi:hypothetical protein
MEREELVERPARFDVRLPRGGRFGEHEEAPVVERLETGRAQQLFGQLRTIVDEGDQPEERPGARRVGDVRFGRGVRREPALGAADSFDAARAPRVAKRFAE